MQLIASPDPAPDATRDSIIFFTYAGVYLLLGLVSIIIARRHNDLAGYVLLPCLCAALCYDNTAVAVNAIVPTGGTVINAVLKVRAAVQCFIIPLFLITLFEMNYEVHKRRSSNFFFGFITFDQGHRTSKGVLHHLFRYSSHLLGAAIALLFIIVNAPYITHPSLMPETLRFTNWRLGIHQTVGGTIDWSDAMDFFPFLLFLLATAYHGLSLWRYGTSVSTDVRSTSINPWVQITVAVVGLTIAWALTPATWLLPYAVGGMLVALLIAMVGTQALIELNLRTLDTWDATLQAANDAVLAAMARNAKERERELLALKQKAAAAAEARRAARAAAAAAGGGSGPLGRVPSGGSMSGAGARGGVPSTGIQMVPMGGSKLRPDAVTGTSVVDVAGGASKAMVARSQSMPRMTAAQLAASTAAASGSVHIAVGDAGGDAAKRSPRTGDASTASTPAFGVRGDGDKDDAAIGTGRSGRAREACSAGKGRGGMGRMPSFRRGISGASQQPPGSGARSRVDSAYTDGGAGASEYGDEGYLDDEEACFDEGDEGEGDELEGDDDDAYDQEGGGGRQPRSGRRVRSGTTVSNASGAGGGLVSPSVAHAVHMAIVHEQHAADPLAPSPIPLLVTVPQATQAARHNHPLSAAAGATVGAGATAAGTPPAGTAATTGTIAATSASSSSVLRVLGGGGGSAAAAPAGASTNTSSTSGVGRLAALLPFGSGSIGRATLPLSNTPSGGHASVGAPETPSHWLMQEHQWKAMIDKSRSHAGAGSDAGATAPAATVGGGGGGGGRKSGTSGGTVTSGSASAAAGAVPLWSRSYAEADLEDRIVAAAVRARAEASGEPASAPATSAAVPPPAAAKPVPSTRSAGAPAPPGSTSVVSPAGSSTSASSSTGGTGSSRTLDKRQLAALAGYRAPGVRPR